MKLKKLLQLTIPLSFCLCPPIIFIISSCGNQSIPKAPNEFYSGVNDYDNTFAKKMHPWKDAWNILGVFDFADKMRYKEKYSDNLIKWDIIENTIERAKCGPQNDILNNFKCKISEFGRSGINIKYRLTITSNVDPNLNMTIFTCPQDEIHHTEIAKYTPMEKHSESVSGMPFLYTTYSWCTLSDNINGDWYKYAYSTFLEFADVI